MSKKKRLPNMNDWTAQQIHEFWSTHSSADFWDESEEVSVKVIRKRKQPVSVKLSTEDIEKLKEVAAELGMAYTTLLRVWIKEKLHETHVSS